MPAMQTTVNVEQNRKSFWLFLFLLAFWSVVFSSSMMNAMEDARSDTPCQVNVWLPVSHGAFLVLCFMNVAVRTQDAAAVAFAGLSFTLIMLFIFSWSIFGVFLWKQDLEGCDAEEKDWLILSSGINLAIVGFQVVFLCFQTWYTARTGGNNTQPHTDDPPHTIVVNQHQAISTAPDPSTSEQVRALQDTVSQLRTELVELRDRPQNDFCLVVK
mmetsp:Transcript_34022/g.68075  ORF Transcript_34022/g.68075 Transcript_34022/m.68075 type:complete len:214 (+) Transcript_34022:14-655(+)|eukprot:CAMPEP_0196731856 /NCGR_PEP_ID=MMETSP1091-20130531/11415_1 /TAXON_ID=302021 /ORGANISM="Rhodomonas sp., Strain CCMP768" /LENGTH=213 /DNA_ID=CAMNT_0042075029 /DNA_START=13 /DNA_END=654 /DNA_ORIENTATION=+